MAVKRMLVVVVAIGVTSMFFWAVSYAQQGSKTKFMPQRVEKISPKAKVKIKKVPPVEIPVDLGIFAVGNKSFSGGKCSLCQEQLDRVGVIFLNDITVGISCNSPTAQKAKGEVKVLYADVLQGRLITVTKTFEVPCKGQPREVLVTVVNSPVLIGTPPGLWATVKPIGVFVDSNHRNDTKSETDPRNMCVMGRVY